MLKKQVIVYNELYVQNNMEYQALAYLVGVKITDDNATGPMQDRGSSNDT